MSDVTTEEVIDVWSVETDSDSTISGKPMEVVSVVDEHNKKYLGAIVG